MRRHAYAAGRLAWRHRHLIIAAAKAGHAWYNTRTEAPLPVGGGVPLDGSRKTETVPRKSAYFYVDNEYNIYGITTSASPYTSMWCYNTVSGLSGTIPGQNGGPTTGWCPDFTAQCVFWRNFVVTDIGIMVYQEPVSLFKSSETARAPGDSTTTDIQPVYLTCSTGRGYTVTNPRLTQDVAPNRPIIVNQPYVSYEGARTNCTSFQGVPQRTLFPGGKARVLGERWLKLRHKIANIDGMNTITPSTTPGNIPAIAFKQVDAAVGFCLPELSFPIQFYSALGAGSIARGKWCRIKYMFKVRFYNRVATVLPMYGQPTNSWAVTGFGAGSTVQDVIAQTVAGIGSNVTVNTTLLGVMVPLVGPGPGGMPNLSILGGASGSVNPFIDNNNGNPVGVGWPGTVGSALAAGTEPYIPNAVPPGSGFGYASTRDAVGVDTGVSAYSLTGIIEPEADTATG